MVIQCVSKAIYWLNKMYNISLVYAYNLIDARRQFPMRAVLYRCFIADDWPSLFPPQFVSAGHYHCNPTISSRAPSPIPSRSKSLIAPLTASISSTSRCALVRAYVIGQSIESHNIFSPTGVDEHDAHNLCRSMRRDWAMCSRERRVWVVLAGVDRHGAHIASTISDCWQASNAGAHAIEGWWSPIQTRTRKRQDTHWLQTRRRRRCNDST